MNKLNLRRLERSIIASLSLLLVFGLQSVLAQQKIGHLDSETIFSTMPEFKTAQTSLEAINKTKMAELEKMKTEIQTKYNQGVAKNKTLSEANKDVVLKELQVLNDELENLKKRLDAAYQKAQEDLAAKEAELIAPVRTKFINAIKAVAKEKGLAYVFDTAKDPNNNLITWDGGVDIASAVKEKLGITTAATAAPKK